LPKKINKDFDPNYGFYELGDRYAMDQVPCTLQESEFTLHPKGTQGQVQISKIRPGRFCTIQPTIRCQGEQNIPPILIFSGKPDVNDPSIAPGIFARKMPDRSSEKDHYDKRVIVLFSETSFAREEQIMYWAKDFARRSKKNKGNKKDKFIAVTMDNHKAQTCEDLQKFFKTEKIQPCYTPANCTDCVAVIDNELGHFLKTGIKQKFENILNEDLELFEEWCEDGHISARETRIMVTRLLGETWDELKEKPKLILKSFKQCGFANDRDGRENDQLRIKDLVDFQLPAYGTPKMKPLNQQQIELSNIDNMTKLLQLRQDKKQRRKRKRRQDNFKRTQLQIQDLKRRKISKRKK
jgi:hypothetical protein